jgi:hypothetical protein
MVPRTLGTRPGARNAACPAVPMVQHCPHGQPGRIEDPRRMDSLDGSTAMATTRTGGPGAMPTADR